MVAGCVVAAAACGTGRASMETGTARTPAPAQEFSRPVAATTAKVVDAAVAVFGENGIPVATADQANGFVQSVPLDLQGNWGNVPVAERVNCVGGVPAPDQRVRLAVQVQSTATGSTVALQSLPVTPAKDRNAAGPCVLKSEFLTHLLDDIASRAGAS
jgi:hypothetical protein